MDVFEAIKNRRSIGKLKQDPVDRELIEQLLEAAVCAPNHYLTEPWRFFVMTGTGRQSLADVFAEIEQEQLDDPTTEESIAKINTQAKKPFRAPVVIAVATIVSDNPRAFEIEDLAAVHASVQNMLLAAHALGLGAIWRSGFQTYHPLMKQLFNLGERDALVGFIYVGHPDITPKPRPRASSAKSTVWVDDAAVLG